MNQEDNDLLAYLADKGLLKHSEKEECVQIMNETGLSATGVLLSENKFSLKKLSRVLSDYVEMDIPPLSEMRYPDSSLFELLPRDFCLKHYVAPISNQSGTMLVAALNPHYKQLVEEISFMSEQTPSLCLASPNQLKEMLQKNTFHETLEESETGENRIVQLVQSMLTSAYERRASDIHIEPGPHGVRLRYRIDGVLIEIPGYKIILEELPALVSRIKIMSGMDISEKRLPQDGRILFRHKQQDGVFKEIDVRVSVIPSIQGEAVVMRILDREAILMDIRSLDFSKQELNLIHQSLSRSHGMIILTGPTGSGKTTTLYAMLSSVNQPQNKILTIEDPVEYQIEGIEQVQAHPEIGLTFAEGLRSFLRHDPDIIMVGEIRDEETAEIAIRSSLTGHLVLSTLHTNDTASATTRLIDMKVKPYLVASTLALIISQRLVRTLCAKCRRKTKVKADVIKEYGLTGKLRAGSLIYEAVGCDECNGTGYRGRSALYEFLPVSDAIREAVVDEKSSAEIRKIALKEGMRTLLDAGIIKVKKGVTTLEEVFRVTHEF